MTQIHQFYCDICTKKAAATWNGEHWLPPKGWIDLVDGVTCRSTKKHICQKCFEAIENYPGEKKAVRRV